MYDQVADTAVISPKLLPYGANNGANDGAIMMVLLVMAGQCDASLTVLEVTSMLLTSRIYTRVC